jgi:hypothetical protein
VATFATPTYLTAGELAIRAAIHAPLLEDHDFRHDRAANTIIGDIEYDNRLGWRLKPFISRESFHTLQGEAKAAGVLAVGSSFTAGSGVSDEETWPAQLEQLPAGT